MDRSILRKVRNLVAAVALPAAALVACHDSDTSKGASGIGTVERNDSVLAIHYYRNTFNIKNAELYPDLKDSMRVAFSGKGWLVDENDGAHTYDFELTRVSGDLRQPMLVVDSVARDSADVMAIARSTDCFYSQNLHITRDWRRDDYFDATAVYYGCDDGEGDYFGLVYDTTDVDSGGVQVFWLRLFRHSTDTAQVITRDISVPVNALRDSTKERILMRFKRFKSDGSGDTVVTDYVYSYINWIESSSSL